MLEPNTPTTSSYCASNACAEATLIARGVRLRDTKPGGAAVVFTLDAWRHFVAALKGRRIR